jgi:two-component system NtrC family response regulator
MTNILVIDKNREYCDRLSKAIQKKGYHLTCVHNLTDGVNLSRQHPLDVILLDNSAINGHSIINSLQVLHNSNSAPEVIVTTEKMDPDEAEQVIESGAWDYMVKPRIPNKMMSPLTSIIEYRSKRRSTAADRESGRFPGIVGKSECLQNCLDLTYQAACSDANVLLTGETGTGKELLATALHRNSRRAAKPFVVVDCAALPETLVESTLFGHERGAFTGAVRQQHGLVKQADGGTLFLDEIGELPLSLQKSFLRVLETKRFRPVGSSQECRSDFRLVVATNQDLDRMVAEGQFREDLLFRLRAFNIHLPPLRQRSQDIAELCRFFFNKLKKHTGASAKDISREFLCALRKYHWPGNVRELFQALERSVATAQDSSTLFPKHLPSHIRINIVRREAGDRTNGVAGKTARTAAGPTITLGSELSNLQDAREEAIAALENDYLRELAVQSNGNVQEACRLSGLSRSRLYALLKKYDLSIRSHSL